MSATLKLRTALLAVLAGSATACGGSTSADLDGTGGESGSGASAGSGASSGSGGFGASAGFGGSGATAGSGASAGFGGSGATAGSGGVGAQAGTGGQGASGGVAGDGGSGALAGSAGEGGSAGYKIEGQLDCSNCSNVTWTTCWQPNDVPVYDGSTVQYDPKTGCVAANFVQGYPYEPCGENGFSAGFQEPFLSDGMCCYPTYTQCPGGRPFLVSGEVRRAGLAARRDWASDLGPADVELDECTRQALMRAWADDARMEHASVAAFARLTLELMAFGAPPELIVASQQASLDEVRHAQDTFGLASRFARSPLGPTPLDVSQAVESQDLVQLAICTFEEGCVGETLAALFAEQQRDLCQDPQTQGALSRIAREEAEHAALAWRIVRWALAQDVRVGSALRKTLKRIEASPGHFAELPSGVDRGLWARFGRLTPEQMTTLRRQALAEVVLPCLDHLLAAEDRVAA